MQVEHKLQNSISAVGWIHVASGSEDDSERLFERFIEFRATDTSEFPLLI